MPETTDIGPTYRAKQPNDKEHRILNGRQTSDTKNIYHCLQTTWHISYTKTTSLQVIQDKQNYEFPIVKQFTNNIGIFDITHRTNHDEHMQIICF